MQILFEQKTGGRGGVPDIVIERKTRGKGEQLTLPTCQGTGSTSWRHVPAWADTLYCQVSMSVWLRYPGAPSYPSPAKILVVVPIQNRNARVTLVGCGQTEGWGIEAGSVSLTYTKKELLHAVWQVCMHCRKSKNKWDLLFFDWDMHTTRVPVKQIAAILMHRVCCM